MCESDARTVRRPARFGMWTGRVGYLPLPAAVRRHHPDLSVRQARRPGVVGDRPAVGRPGCAPIVSSVGQSSRIRAVGVHYVDACGPIPRRVECQLRAIGRVGGGTIVTNTVREPFRWTRPISMNPPDVGVLPYPGRLAKVETRSKESAPDLEAARAARHPWPTLGLVCVDNLFPVRRPMREPLKSRALDDRPGTCPVGTGDPDVVIVVERRAVPYAHVRKRNLAAVRRPRRLPWCIATAGQDQPRLVRP